MATDNQPVYLGVDVGTSGCRTIAVTAAGTTLAAADRSYPLITPAAGHVEQDPDEWIRAAFATIAEVCASGAFEPSRIAGVGVDGQSWACVPISADGRVLANTPIWMDVRAQSICDDLLTRVPAEDLLALAGNRLSPSYSTAKAIWYQRERPDVFAQARWFLQCNSTVVHALTGVASQDHSQGYGWHFIDVATGRVDAAMAERLGIDPDRIPEPVEPTEVVGGITLDAARVTGLPVGTPVVAGGLDAACGTLGAGVHRPGQTQEQSGQAGGMSIALATPVADQRLILSRHVVPDSWLLQGGTVAGAASLAWLARVAGEAEASEAERTGTGQYEQISRLAGQVPPGAGGLIFLPYLSGERSPIWDPDARGAFLGLQLATERAHLYRAVMEGVAMALRHNLAVASDAGAVVRELRAVGGATRSPVWMQLKADVTGLPISISGNANPTPLGAAMLAAIGTGGGDVESLIGKWVTQVASYLPDPATAECYGQLYEVYSALYPTLSDSMHALAGIGRANGRN